MVIECYRIFNSLLQHFSCVFLNHQDLMDFIIDSRHAHNLVFDKSDLFFICMLRALSSKIVVDDHEIEAAKVRYLLIIRQLEETFFYTNIDLLDQVSLFRLFYSISKHIIIILFPLKFDHM